MFIGANHKRVADTAQSIHTNTSVVLQEDRSLRIPTNTDELAEKAKSGEMISDALADNALMELLIYEELGKKMLEVFGTRTERNKVLLRIVESLSESERELLHNTFMSSNDPIISKHISNLLKQKNIALEENKLIER